MKEPVRLRRGKDRSTRAGRSRDRVRIIVLEIRMRRIEGERPGFGE